MTSFLLVVNILALTLPFLAAEVQNQEQAACHENNERFFAQKMSPFFPIQHVLNSYHHSDPNYYQHAPISNLYMPYPYSAKLLVFRPQAQIPQWQGLPSIYQSTMVHHPYFHPSFMAVPPKKPQEKITIPASDNSATVEPSSVPANEPAVNTVIIPETSPEFVNAPETASVPVTTTVPVTSPVASEQEENIKENNVGLAEAK